MQRPLQLNLLKIIILMGLLFLEGPLFADVSVIKNETDSKASEVTPQEDHDEKDLEALLKRYNKNSKKVLEDTSTLHNIQNTDSDTEVADAELENIKAQGQAGFQKKEAKAPLKELPTKLSDSVALALEPIQKLSEKELLKRLDETTVDSPIGPYFKQFPQITLLTIRLIKDKESIPSMVKIVEDKERLIEFVSLMLCTILFAYLLKRFMHKEGRTFLRAAFYFLVRTAIMMTIRLTIIYYYFSEEFTPAFRVIKETLK